MKRSMQLLTLFLVSGVILSACGAASQSTQDTQESGLVNPDEPQSTSEDSSNSPATQVDRDYEIITLLPKDAIPSIDNPRFLSADEADEEYAPTELVIGVEFEGDARAYSIGHLSRHEIVNDTVGGRKIAVTW